MGVNYEHLFCIITKILSYKNRITCVWFSLCSALCGWLRPDVWCPAATPMAPLEVPGPPATQPKPQDPRGLLEVRKREEAKLIKNLITGAVGVGHSLDDHMVSNLPPQINLIKLNSNFNCIALNQRYSLREPYWPYMHDNPLTLAPRGQQNTNLISKEEILRRNAEWGSLRTGMVTSAIGAILSIHTYRLNTFSL